MPAPAFAFLPQGLALAGQSQIILRSQKDEIIDDGGFCIQSGQLGTEVLRLRGTTSQEQANSHLPGLAVLAHPMADADGSVSRMLPECPLAHDVLQPPWPDLHTMLVASLQKGPQTTLQFAGGAGQGPLRFELPPGGLYL